MAVDDLETHDMSNYDIGLVKFCALLKFKNSHSGGNVYMN